MQNSRNEEIVELIQLVKECEELDIARILSDDEKIILSRIKEVRE